MSNEIFIWHTTLEMVIFSSQLSAKHRPSDVYHPPSTIFHPPLSVHHFPSTIQHLPPNICHPPPTTIYHPSSSTSACCQQITTENWQFHSENNGIKIFINRYHCESFSNSPHSCVSAHVSYYARNITNIRWRLGVDCFGFTYLGYFA